jgi:hypothetical protein
MEQDIKLNDFLKEILKEILEPIIDESLSRAMNKYINTMNPDLCLDTFPPDFPLDPRQVFLKS